MIITGQKYKEIQIVSEIGELIASITDENIIEEKEYKVVCIPDSD